MARELVKLGGPEVLGFHKSLSNWGRWGERDQLGALNLTDARKRAAAAASVRSGRTVCCARALDTVLSPENTAPVLHHMIGTASEQWGGDWFGIAPPGFAARHAQALR